MGDDLTTKLKRVLLNEDDDSDNGNDGKKYKDEKHAIEPCEEFESDE